MAGGIDGCFTAGTVKPALAPLPQSASHVWRRVGKSMGSLRRRGRIGRALRAGLPALILSAGLSPALAAKLIAAKGSETSGYGRIVLTFDKPVPVKATVSGGVLVLGYGERTAAGPERLAEDLPAYVASARRDPDGTGLRLALQRPYRANVQMAGERVFVDLLPEGWNGLPPPLPPEVVADLAGRAQAAEEALKARLPIPARKTLALELGRLPTLTRLSLRLPDDAIAAVTAEGDTTRLRVAGLWTIDATGARGRPRPGLAKLASESDDASASLIVTPAEGFVVTSEREDGAITLDLVRKRVPVAVKAKPTEIPGPAAADVAQAKIEQAKIGQGESEQSEAAQPQIAQAQALQSKPADPKPPAMPAPRLNEAVTDETGVAGPPRRRAGAGLVFPFHTLPPAVLLERGGIATLAFETAEPVALPSPASGFTRIGEARRIGPLTLLRFSMPPGRLIDLAAVSAGTGLAWELSAGDVLSPSGTLDPERRPDAAGRIGVSVALPRPGSATWVDLDGERVALVTSAARRPVGNPKSRRFVDFEILPSRHGLAVLAGADDLAVRPDLDGVTIGREGGLSASAAVRKPDATLAEAGPLAVPRESWEQARFGAVRDTLRGLAAVASEAPLAERGPARLALARAAFANGFDPEGLSVLEIAAADDPLLASRRETAILRGLALVRLGRSEEARRALAGERLAQDPEAALWRAVAAAGAADWKAAETGFLKVLPFAERYPDDLALPIRVLAAESAIETGDVETASARAADLRDVAAPLRDRLALVRARVVEAAGQTEAALDAYARLAEAAERPVAVDATLRGALLARGAGKLTPDAAIERLERLALTWRGGPTEEGITAGLARLYLGAGRWRDGFNAVRRANGLAPNAAITRAVTAEAQAAFDDLYLGSKGEKLSGIEAVALYFDFRDLAPIGRRGDEVVRRLADRLVGLDLLDSASDLLQHQIDHRLTGPARAAVATRLATVRLMDAKPMMALAALDATDLPELPGDLKRARGLIRARALSDLTRTDLALESIEDETGADIERLRADILWGARRWREAGEAHEALLGETWRFADRLDAASRADAVRAAIAYDLAGEAIGLERLKAKFSGAMAQGPDARTFALLTASDAVRKPGFREIAAQATKAETLSAFLAEYRKRYPDAAVPNRGGPDTSGAGEPAKETRAATPGTPPG